MLCGISPGFPELSPTRRQVGHVLLTRSPLYSRGCPRFLVRLACVRHAASVDSEPGSNSRLKPDVCRRVVGRLVRAFGCQLSAFSQEPEPATLALERRSGLSCEIRSDSNPSLPLTTGTFNLIVKDRIAFRLSGAPSVPAGHSPASPRNFWSETLQNYAFPATTVNPLHTQNFHRRGTWQLALGIWPAQDRNGLNAKCQLPSAAFLQARARMDFRSLQRRFSARADTEANDSKKDPVWRFLQTVKPEDLTYRTLRGTQSPNPAPWPRRFQVLPCFLLDAGRETRVS
jgi:hypothetical protein